MCVAAHGWKSADGPPDSSNCYCLPGRAGGSPADASHEVDDWWRIAPFYGAVGVAVLWHLALIARIKERARFHIVYALLFTPIFYYFCVLSLVLAIRFPL